MLRGESLWLPKINDNRYRTKPPLFYWSALLTSRIVGEVNEFSLRFSSVLAGSGTVFLTTLLGSWLFSPTAGCVAGLVLATSWRFVYLASHSRIDMVFTLFILVAFAALWVMVTERDEALKKRASWIAAVAMGLALLTKGPLGYIFPLLSIFILQRFKNITIPWARVVLIPLGTILIWIAFGILEGGKEFQTIIIQETVGRLSGDESIQIHKEPFYFYIPQIFLGLAPWSLFLPVVLWSGIRNNKDSFNWLFPAIAIMTLFVFLSLLTGKRGDYLLPIYPMAALLTAQYFSSSTSPAQFEFNGFKWTTRILIYFFILLAIILCLAPGIPAFLTHIDWSSFSSKDHWMMMNLVKNHYPSPFTLLLSSVIMLLFALGLALALKKRSRGGVWAGLTGWAIMVLMFAHGPLAKIVNQYSSLKPFAHEVAKVTKENPIVHFDQVREDLLFYLARPVEETSLEVAVQRVLDQGDSFLLMKKSQSRDVLKKNRELKVVLETNPLLFKQYQLINNGDFIPKREP